MYERLINTNSLISRLISPIFAFVLFSLLINSCQTSVSKKYKNIPDLTSRIDSIITKNHFNGVVLLTNKKNTLYSKVAGYSDIEKKTPLTLNNQFVIGSISKQITAVLVLIEYENGRINLDDTVAKYLNNLNQSWAKKVTIHQLLTHTHGIIDLEKPLEFDPGSKFQYSQLGYELLAQILQQITGHTFEKIATDFFQKHGLKNTFHPNNKKYKLLVKAYEEDENGNLVYTANSFDNYPAAGGFISNAKDLLKWNEKLYSGQLVNTKTLKLMSTKFATRIHPIFETINYGYGLLFKEGEQNIQIGALGYAPGFVSA